MQHMPDKDFDNLFRDKFMDAEIEPSADLWGNIAEQLEPKRKRSFPLMWVAAASVAVVASVMMFTRNGEKVYLQGTPSEVAVVKPTEKAQILPVVTTDETNMVTPAVLPEHVSNRHLVKTAVVNVTPAQIEDTQKNIIAMQPSAQDEHLVIKREEVKPLDVTLQETKVADSHETRMIAQVNNTKITNVDDLEPTEDTSDSKKTIRNVGDLINYVVDKVDKREKKLIKFDTDDDDNSSIIGLNIGFVKLNKRK